MLGPLAWVSIHHQEENSLFLGKEDSGGDRIGVRQGVGGPAIFLEPALSSATISPKRKTAILESGCGGSKPIWVGWGVIDARKQVTLLAQGHKCPSKTCTSSQLCFVSSSHNASDLIR